MRTHQVDKKKCWVVENQRPFSYQIIQTSDLFNINNPSLLIGRNHKKGKVFVVVEKVIYELFKDQLSDYFANFQIETNILQFQGGEGNKSIDSFIKIFSELNKFQINRRNEPIIALGGGVLIDIVGFVASCFRRGVPHVRVPTNLMGYIDAAIGIKTGINFNNEKNRMGSFEPPTAVILDTQFFQSLDLRQIVNACGEIVKIAVSKNKDLFALLEKDGRRSIEDKFQNSGQQILDIAINDMLEELEPNLYEENLARVVDFGHTFSPTIEMAGVDDLLHGEAVVIDIAYSIFLSHCLGYLTYEQCERICNLIAKLDLPLWSPHVSPELLWKGLQERIYHRNGQQQLPIPDDIGHCIFLNNVSKEDVQRAYDAYMNYLETTTKFREDAK